MKYEYEKNNNNSNNNFTKKNCHFVSRRVRGGGGRAGPEQGEVAGVGWGGVSRRGLRVGTRLGHLRGLLERKSHAPRLLLPTVVPSFDCDSMNNAWRMGLKEEEG